MTTTQTIVCFGFALMNGCRLLAYLPQIIVLIRQRDSGSASSATWVMFFLSNGMTSIYAASVIADAVMALTFLANAICCGIIVALIRCKRKSRPITDDGCLQRG